MKNWIMAFVAGALLAGATPLIAEEVYRIEIGRPGKSNPSYSDRDLKFRLAQLELAVDQLQRKVFDLETIRREPKTPAPSWTTCMIKTPFDGVFSATEPTEMAAKAKAMEKCAKKSGNSISCNERELKCGN